MSNERLTAAKLFQSLVDVAKVCLFRFPPLARVWVVLLVAANACGLFFLHTPYGKAAVAAAGAGLLIVLLIHFRLGFVRLLGVGHVLWYLMLPWMIYQLPTVDRGSWLYLWLICLIVCNSISLVVDTIDVIRFVRGEREPYYSVATP